MNIEDIIDNMTAAQFWAVVVFLVGLMLIARRYRMGGTTRGSAHWLKLWQAAWAVFPSVSAGVGLFLSVDLLGNPGFLLGDWRGIPIGRWHIPCLLPIFYRGPSNILTVGSPGSMKGAAVLNPNALRQPFQVLYDLGGEITAVCVAYWRRRGYKVLMMNPWGLFAGSPYNFDSGSLNPFDTLDPASKDFSSDVGFMAEDLMGDPPKGDAIFFYNMGRSWFNGLIRFNVLHDMDCNLVRIRQYIRSDMTDLIVRMKASPDEIVQATGHEIQTTLDTNPKNFGNIISEMVSVTGWLDDTPIRQSICNSTIRLADIKGYDADGKKLKGAIFTIIIPQKYKTTYPAFVKILFSSVLREMMSSDVARSKVLMSIDEFPTLKKFSKVVDALADMRRWNLRINLIVQSIAQLKDIYGEAGWKVIEAGCDVRQYLSAWGLDTAEHVSKMCGDMTMVEKTERGETLISRRLITPDEVMRLPVKEQIVFIGNLSPARLRIRPYWERRYLRARVQANPFHGSTPRGPITAPAQTVLGLSMRFVAGLAGPVGLAAAAALAIAYGGLL